MKRLVISALTALLVLVGASKLYAEEDKGAVAMSFGGSTIALWNDIIRADGAIPCKQGLPAHHARSAVPCRAAGCRTGSPGSRSARSRRSWAGRSTRTP